MTAVDFTPLGLMVGHATDREGATGVTVVRHAQTRWRGGYCIVGRATGTRELNALSPTSLADRVDAVMLTGGSAYGLDAAAGVMRWMEEQRRGHPMADFVVPIVPAAVIFDLLPLGRPDARPTPEMAYAACDTAQSVGFREGSVGAGTGATVGKIAGREGAMKGGVGCWFEQVDELMVGAVAVVNAFGDVRDAQGTIIAGARTPDGMFLDSAKNRHAKLAMRHFATAEAHGDLHLVPFLDELEDLFHLRVIIVVVDVRTHLDLLDLLRLLLLALLVGLFLRFIFEAADVEEFGDGRVGVGRDFDEVEPDLLRLLEGLTRIHHTQILAVLVDHPNLLGLDELVVTGAGKLRRRLRTARIGRGYSRVSLSVERIPRS